MTADMTTGVAANAASSAATNPTSDPTINPTTANSRERILNAAEQLFAEPGISGTSLLRNREHRATGKRAVEVLKI